MGLNPFEGFIKGKVADLLKKVESIDADKDGAPDIKEIKDELAELEEKLVPIINKFDAKGFEAIAADIAKKDLTDACIDVNAFFSKNFSGADLAILLKEIPNLFALEAHIVGLVEQLPKLL